MSEITASGPMSKLHADQPILTAGVPLAQARAAVVLIHGRGATAESILDLTTVLHGADLAYLAPQAAGQTWYPQSFLAPLAANEPWLSSALATLDGLLAQVAASGIVPAQTVLLGFSQGACLALEYGARHAQHWGGLVGLSGGLIGPAGTPRDYTGTLTGTPVFLGCSDIDAHIPKSRVIESGDVFRRLGATVDLRLYPGMGHTINRDELTAVQDLLDALGRD